MKNGIVKYPIYLASTSGLTTYKVISDTEYIAITAGKSGTDTRYSFDWYFRITSVLPDIFGWPELKGYKVIDRYEFKAFFRKYTDYIDKLKKNIDNV